MNEERRAKVTRRIAATELRVHLGETLRALDDEEFVIEKGGVPVAVLRKYEAHMARANEDIDEAYARALSKKGDRNAWARAAAAMERGWVGIDVDRFIADVARWREEGTKPAVSLEGMDDAGDVPRGQQYPDRGDAAPQHRVAEGPAEPYRA